MDEIDYILQDIKEFDKLMQKIFDNADDIYEKYYNDPFKESFFTQYDYDKLVKIYKDAKVVYDEALKLFNVKLDTFKWYVPFDLTWKIPTGRVYNEQNIKDMILICYDIKELSDDLGFLFDYYRASNNQNKVLTGFDLKNMKADLDHLRLIIDYAKRNYGLEFKEAITEIPDDIMLMIPVNERVN
jgi:hypothetical protein